jgi:hypothetical protein
MGDDGEFPVYHHGGDLWGVKKLKSCSQYLAIDTPNVNYLLYIGLLAVGA